MDRRSNSPYEGEYSYSRSESKANRPSSYRNDHRVNSKARPNNDRYRSRSRSRSPYRAPRDSASGRHRNDYRDRDRGYRDSRRSRTRSPSPSPYRVPRGDDRRRNDDRHHDSPSRHESRSYKNFYDEEKTITHRSEKGRSPRASGRESVDSRKSRSRSPYRRPQSKERDDIRSQRDSPFVSTSTSAQKAPQVTAPKFQPVQNGTHVDEAETDHAVRDGSSTNTVQGTTAAEVVPDPVELDPQAIIEARRKRREAIKAKYAAESLLKQTLNGQAEAHVNDNASATLKQDSPTPSAFSTPHTPATFTDSNPASPTPNSPGDIDMMGLPAYDSPAAADYDPTADMAEERARHASSMFKEDDKSEDRAAEQAKAQQPEAPRTDEDDDMFDMFAEGNNDTLAKADEQVKKKATSAGTELKASLMDNWDDPEGYYKTLVGELLDSRYKVTEYLGRGMFASVVRASDEKSGLPVAIKIVRNNESMKKAGNKEVEILIDLAANDPKDQKHVIRLLRSFEHKQHLCMVFENMSMNLRDLLKKYGRNVGLSMKVVRQYARQIFIGLDHLRKRQFLHADLKPDNILINESRSTVKIADLGSATPARDNLPAPYLVSRFYRAPEVMLGIEHDYGIDMWAFGCTLYELFTGKILFTGDTNNAMLKSIMDCRGKFPNKVLRKGELAWNHFDLDTFKFRSNEVNAFGKEYMKEVAIPLRPVKDLKTRLWPKDRKLGEQEKKELESFVDLLDKCLQLSPEKRITPSDALKHPFIANIKIK